MYLAGFIHMFYLNQKRTDINKEVSKDNFIILIHSEALTKIMTFYTPDLKLVELFV